MNIRNEIAIALRDFGQSIVTAIIDAQQKAGKKATGASANALTYEVDNKGVRIIDPLGYIIYQEYGRGAGKKPPIEPLKEWALSKGLPIGVAWAVQANIAKFGTLTFQKKAPALGLKQILSQERINQLAKDLSSLVSITIKDNIIKELK